MQRCDKRKANIRVVHRKDGGRLGTRNLLIIRLEVTGPGFGAVGRAVAITWCLPYLLDRLLIRVKEQKCSEAWS